MPIPLHARTAPVLALGAALALVPAGAAAAADAPAVTRISLAYDGTQADSGSNAPSLSGDGRFLVYSSNATNLVPGDTNDLLDLFLHDRSAGTTELVSRGVGGAPTDGRSTDERISADGRFVAFASEATNLVAGDTDGESNVFVWDRSTRAVTRLPGADAHWPDISGDGRYVTYSTYDALVPGDTDDFIDVYLHDRETGESVLVTRDAGGRASGGYDSVISDDGRFIVYGARSGTRLFDRTTGTSTPVTGRAGSLAISGDGAYVTISTSDALVPEDTNFDNDIYLWERQTGAFTAVSVAPDGRTTDAFSFQSQVNADGRYVTFWSTARDLSGTQASGWGTQAYRYDRQTGRNTLLAVPVKGDDGGAEGTDLSADGTVIGFMSLGEDLVADDTNGERDVFVTVLP